MNILVIDDEQAMRDLFMDVLGTKGFKEVKVATGWEEATKLIRTYNFDIVFLDVVMPEKNGVEVFHMLRKIKPSIEVVMMTGYAVGELLYEALNAGAFDYLYKPFDILEIESAISKLKKKLDLKPLRNAS
jgi:DNA-binding NtrC family response regulator